MGKVLKWIRKQINKFRPSKKSCQNTVPPTDLKIWEPSNDEWKRCFKFYEEQLRIFWRQKIHDKENHGTDIATISCNPNMGPLILIQNSKGLELCFKGKIYKAWEDGISLYSFQGTYHKVLDCGLMNESIENLSANTIYLEQIIKTKFRKIYIILTVRDHRLY